jgi:hypothetical protein
LVLDADTSLPSQLLLISELLACRRGVKLEWTGWHWSWTIRELAGTGAGLFGSCDEAGKQRAGWSVHRPLVDNNKSMLKGLGNFVVNHV